MANPENFVNQSNINILLQAQPMTLEGGKSSSSGFSQLITWGAKISNSDKMSAKFIWARRSYKFCGVF